MSLPSFYTIPVILGTCLIIFFTNQNNILSNFLSLKFLVFIGLISYSLYLWHYPIFSFYNYIFFSAESTFYKILIIFLSIILSILSFNFIEKPFRNQKIISNKKLFLNLISMLFIIIFFSLSIFYKGKGYQENIYEKVNIDNLFYIIEVRDVLNKLNYQYSRFSPFTEAKKNVLIVGNSHADDLFLILKNNSYYSEEFNFHVVRFDFIEKNLNHINTINKKRLNYLQNQI